MKADNERGTGPARVGRMLATLGIAAALAVGASAPAVAQEEDDEPGGRGGLYGELDSVADAATCDGPLGFVLNSVVNCDPEDEPPFQSYENGEF